MKTLKYKIFSVLFVVLLIFSCSDEFLETKPIGTDSEVSFYTTMQAADMATTVCYSIFSMEKVWDLTIVMALGSISSDEAEAGAGGKSDVIEYQQIDQLRHHPSTPNAFSQVYGYLFRSIGYCNTALEKMNPDDPDNQIKQDPAYDLNVIKMHMGEAYFLRAFNFFTLTQIFGGVPKVDRSLSPSEYDMPRSSIKEIYDLAKSDLNKAIELLPEKSYLDGQNQPGRASKGAAKALKAKIYLYESSYAKNYPNDERFAGLVQKWDSVNIMCEDIISSNQYELFGIDGKRDSTYRGKNTGGFQLIFNSDYNNSKEEIFSIQSRQDGLSWFFSRGTALVRWCAPRRIDLSKGATGDGQDHGWGWWCPTDFLADKFDKQDIRLSSTIMDENDSTQIAGGFWAYPNFNTLLAGTGVHYHQKKYEASAAQYWDNTGSWKEGPNNVKLIRYADLVLWNAEAYLERGMNAEALSNINLVRTRARMSGETGVPADLTGTVTHQQIEDERLYELSCEGHRFFDLVRWKLANQYLDHELSNGDQIDFEEGKHEFFPIPQTEMNLSKGALKQNPGY